MTRAIEFESVSKWYGDVIAVNDVTVDVPSGITGLLGPNGAGKSTFMRMCVGLLHPSKGTVRVLGEDPWDNTALRSRVGFVPEGDAPWRDLTGRRAAVMGARLAGHTGADAEAAADRALQQVRLSEVAEKRVDAYSRGMRQKLKFALALVQDPELFILDEPLLGTDPITRRDLIQLIKDLADEGRSVLVSTHVLPDVEAMTQRIMLLSHGRLMAHGEVGEIRDLLDRFPRTVRIATPQPRELGSLLWTWETVLSLEAQEGALVVRTREPQAFYKDLQETLVKKDLPFTSVTALDENVEAIFQYLVGSQ